VHEGRISSHCATVSVSSSKLIIDVPYLDATSFAVLASSAWFSLGQVSYFLFPFTEDSYAINHDQSSVVVR